MAAASLLLAMLLLQAAPAGGSVRVQIMNAATGLPVAGATVELTDLERRVVTAQDGVAAFGTIPPGPHHLRVRRVGFEPRRLHLFAGEQRELQLVILLTPLPIRLAGLRVESGPLIDLPGAEPGASPQQRIVTDAQLRQHPLVPEPDVLLGLTDGHLTARAEAPGGLSLLGGFPDHIAYRVDGIPVRSPYHGGGTFAALSPDAIAESVVETSPGLLPIDDALSGSLRWATRPPAHELRWIGGVSSTQSRVLVEGGNGRVGLMAGGRVLFPGLAWQKREAAHLAGEASDGILRAVVPVAGGTLRGVAFVSMSGASFASRVPEDTSVVPAPRHEFNWRTSTAGVHWDRTAGGKTLAVAVWHSRVGATAEWYPESGAAAFLDTHLRDRGAEASLVQATNRDTWSLAGQVRRRSADYRAVQRTAGVTSSFAPRRERMTALLQSQWKRTGDRAEVTVGSVVGGSSAMRIAPFAELAWRPTSAWRVSVGAARRFQYTQSLRNTESIGGLVFGAEAPMVAGGDGVPVARSDQVVAVASWMSGTSRHITWRGWARRLEGLALPAVGNSYPFAVHAPSRGRGRALGTAVDAAWSAGRWGVLASYGLHDVSFTAADTTWQPEFAVRHVFDAGAIAWLMPQVSLRIGGSAGAGRRVTGFTGNFEWESCNLRDRGCEFAGAPGRTPGALGAVALPPWVRWDATARAHGHLQFAGRDMQVDVFASWSNLFNRRNVLTRVRDKTSGALHDVVMRPSAPLVVGFDWRM